MQVLQENYEQTLRKDLVSKEGIVQTWSQDLDMYGKKGCGGWNFFRNSKEQLQFPYLHDRHCLLLRDELAEMQQVVAALPIHRYRCAAENATAVHRILGALSRHLKQEEVTNMKERMEWSLRNHCECLCLSACGSGRAKHERIRQTFCSVRQVEPDHVRLLWREA